MPPREGAIFWGEGASHCKLWSIGKLYGHLCKSGWTDRDAVWVVGSDGPKETQISWGSRSSHGTGQFWRKGTPIIKYRDCRELCKNGLTDWLAILVGRRCGLRWVNGRTSSIVFARLRQCALMRRHTGVTRRIWMNCPSAAAMWSYVKLLLITC